MPHRVARKIGMTRPIDADAGVLVIADGPDAIRETDDGAAEDIEARTEVADAARCFDADGLRVVGHEWQNVLRSWHCDRFQSAHRRRSSSADSTDASGIGDQRL